MANEVVDSSRGGEEMGKLARKDGRAFDAFVNHLAAHGCQALVYRLSGERPIDHICVKHLLGSLRVVVAFESPRRAWILLGGPHDDQDPVLNVYAELFRLLGTEPQRDSGRDKPPCCDKSHGEPPRLADALADILYRAIK